MRLTAENLAVARGGRRVLEDVSLDVCGGTLLVLAGPNGAGKTSLLRVLSGSLAPVGGSVLWDGIPLSNVPPEKLARHRSFLAQQTDCRLPFTVEEIVLLGAEAAGCRGAVALQAARRAMEVAGVYGLAHRTISQLSGGEQQRVHWARVLAQINDRPEDHLLFLDEPVSSLDLEHQHDLLQTARSLADRGAAVVAVLHDLNLAAQYADAWLVLHEGRPFAQGSPGDVLTEALLETVFRVRGRILSHPRPFVLVDPPSTEKRTDNAQTAP